MKKNYKKATCATQNSILYGRKRKELKKKKDRERKAISTAAGKVVILRVQRFPPWGSVVQDLP